MGTLVFPAAVPHMSLTPPEFRNAGPALGNGNDAILGKLLGLAAEQLADLSARKII